ncbi:unnamed protein product [Allacma fusca]|uniref:Uncharacterized protein n=1 Tax=Allacma fusca TaxID=39272 RepID=A0A8J2JFT2_9HEXA|nr:unnamed protein product [Allacma fusca]
MDCRSGLPSRPRNGGRGRALGGKANNSSSYAFVLSTPQTSRIRAYDLLNDSSSDEVLPCGTTATPAFKGKYTDESFGPDDWEPNRSSRQTVEPQDMPELETVALEAHIYNQWVTCELRNVIYVLRANLFSEDKVEVLKGISAFKEAVNSNFNHIRDLQTNLNKAGKGQTPKLSQKDEGKVHGDKPRHFWHHYKTDHGENDHPENPQTVEKRKH